jgi:phosphoserine phosphatase
VVCFDLDGTLVPGTSTCQHLANVFGWGQAVDEWEQEFAAGHITNRTFAERESVLYVGRSLEDVHTAMRSLPMIDGVVATTEELRRRGIVMLLTTLTWSFAAREVAQQFGFDAWTGPVMLESGGALTGEIAAHFTAADKATFVRAYCRERSVPLNTVIAVGDSYSDVPLFRVVGHSIALNATAAAREAATSVVNTTDLRDILNHIPGW